VNKFTKLSIVVGLWWQAVRCLLEEMVERYDSAIKVCPEYEEIAYVIDMVRYLDDRVG